MIFSELNNRGEHEQVIFCHDKSSGLKGIIAIHNTNLGPALGGCRMWPYKTEKEALEDVLNLSRAMSYKSAVAGVPLGGGKSVIIGDSDKDKTPELFHQFGKYIESLNGRYIVAKDVGITEGDLKMIGDQTEFVVGLPESQGGIGDPSYYTALGVYHGLKEAVRWKLKKNNLKGVKILIQGAGSVGFSLIELLKKEESEIVLSDIKGERVKAVQSRFPSVKSVPPEKLFSISCDVFAPCALGGQVSKENFKNFNCQIVAGAANNQLHSQEMDAFLYKKGVLYVPDFVINSGGLIYVFSSVNKKPADWVKNKIASINEIISQIFKISQEKSVPTGEIALQMAKEKIKEEGKSSFYIRS